MKYTVLFSLFIPQYVVAALFGFCLDDGSDLTGAKKHLEYILAPGDRVFKRGSMNCLEVQGNPQRQDLYHRYLSKKYRVLRSYLGNDVSANKPVVGNRGMCRLTVIKKKKGNSKTDKITIGKNGKFKKTESSMIGNSRSSLILSHGKAGRIQVKGEKVAVVCRKRGSGYELEFSLESFHQNVSSTVFLSRGQEVNIGSVVNDLNQKRKTISTNQGVEYEKTTGVENFDTFLKVQ